MCLFRCFLLIAVFCLCEIRAGVTSDLISVGFLPFSFVPLENVWIRSGFQF